MKDKSLKIIEHYGVMNQLKYFQSEVFELNEAIMDYNYTETHEGNPAEQHLKNHIAEEIADVLVMVNQFKEYYEISDDEILETFNHKVDRQLERIRKEKLNESKSNNN